MKKFALSVGKAVLVIGFWISLWLIIALIVNEPLFLPSPIAVFQRLTELVRDVAFWKSVLNSLLNVVVGVAISFAIGSLLAYLMSVSKILNSLFSPLISVIKATPIASFIVIAVIWFSKSTLPSFIATLIVIPIVTSNISQGIKSVSPELRDVAKIYNFSPYKKLTALYIPSILPFFLAACKSSLGMAWKASVAAEMIVYAQITIGQKLSDMASGMEYDSAFAWTIVTVAMSMALEKLVVFLIDRIGKSLKAIPKGESHVKA